MLKLSTLNIRRLKNFRSNIRGWYSLWIFVLLFIISLSADFISNDKPLLIKYNEEYLFPIVNNYQEIYFGGDFETEADYKDPYVKNLIEENGWMIMPIIPYSYNTIIRDLSAPAPSPPSAPPQMLHLLPPPYPHTASAAARTPATRARRHRSLRPVSSKSTCIMSTIRCWPVITRSLSNGRSRRFEGNSSRIVGKMNRAWGADT